MKLGNYTLPQIKKVIVNILSFVLTLVAALLAGGLIPVEYLPWIVVFIGVCSAYGVFKVQNAPVDGPKHVV